MDNTAQLTINAPMIVTYGLLMLSIISLWEPITPRFNNRIKVWVILFLLSLMFALFWDFVQPIALLPILLFAIACQFMSQKTNNRLKKTIVAFIITLIAIGFIGHFIPGFSNPILISNVTISENSIPYTQFLNFDKALVGLFILAFGTQLLSTKREWFKMLKTALPIVLTLILVVTLLALLIGYIQFDFKLNYLFILWFLPNLFFTCIAEEAFFRGFIQKHLVENLKVLKFGSIVGLSLASLLFGIAHYPGGLNYVLLATVAGFGYGWIYHSTQSIEASILAHLGVNVVHFIFFTYPVLATAIMP